MKVVLVTGGSRGIGRATSVLAAKTGYAVAVNYRTNKLAADRVVAEAIALGAKAVAFQRDISRKEDVERLFYDVEQQLGSVDALVNNAGMFDDM